MEQEALTGAGGKFQHNSPERESRLNLEALSGFNLGLCWPLTWPPPLDVKRLPLVALGEHRRILQIFQWHAFSWTTTTRAHFGRDLNTRVNIVRKHFFSSSFVRPLHSRTQKQTFKPPQIQEPIYCRNQTFCPVCTAMSLTVLFALWCTVNIQEPRVAQNVLWNTSSVNLRLHSLNNQRIFVVHSHYCVSAGQRHLCIQTRNRLLHEAAAAQALV